MSVGRPAIAHAGLLCDDLGSLTDTWQRLFGLNSRGASAWLAAEEGVLVTNFPVPGGGLEPLEPLRPGTVQWEHLQTGRRAFHLSVLVDGLAQVVARLRDEGMRVRVRRPGRVLTLHRAWLDAEQCSGLTVELLDRTEVAAFRAARPATQPVPPVDVPRGWTVISTEAFGHVANSLSTAQRLYRLLDFAAADDESGVRSASGDRIVSRWRAEGGAPVEVVVPTHHKSWFQQHLTRTGPGLAYVSYAVDDLDAAQSWLDAQEAWLWREPADQVGRPSLWVHGRSTGGLAVRLVPA